MWFFFSFIIHPTPKKSNSFLRFCPLRFPRDISLAAVSIQAKNCKLAVADVKSIKRCHQRYIGKGGRWGSGRYLSHILYMNKMSGSRYQDPHTSDKVALNHIDDVTSNCSWHCDVGVSYNYTNGFAVDLCLKSWILDS